MIELSRQQSLLPPEKVVLAGRPLLPALPFAARERARVVPGPCVRAFCDDGQTSRLPAAVPTEGWKLKWQAPLGDLSRPEFIAVDGGRVAAWGFGAWRLFDAGSGEPIQGGRMSESGLLLDAQRGLFYLVDSYHQLIARGLADGGEEFNLTISGGSAYRRPYLARRGRRLLQVGIETATRPNPPEPPKSALIEELELADSLKLDETLMVRNLTALAALRINTTRLVAALHGDELCFAVPGRVYLSSTDLHPRAALEADFTPEWLSIDETGQLYLVVTLPDTLCELWILKPDGQRLATVALPAGQLPLLAPPIVGGDHRVCLVSESMICTYDAESTPSWTKRPLARLAGAAISTDDFLLACAGSAVLAYDGTGEEHLLQALPGAALATPPAMSAAGEIFVASAEALYCLSR